MLILGIDPGATTGWCLYDTDAERVTKAGKFAGCEMPPGFGLEGDVMAIERIEAHGASFPQVVEAAYVAGRIVGEFVCADHMDWHELRRHTIRKTLQEATHGAIRVVDDKTVWSALKLLHGDDSDRKARRRKGQIVEEAGPIGTVTSHERAALAVAVAYAIGEGVMA